VSKKARNAKSVKKTAKKTVKKAAKKADVSKSSKFISVPPLREDGFVAEIIGRNPYVQNRLADKTVDDIEEKRKRGASGAASAGERPPLDPHAEMISKLHIIKAVRNGKGLDLKKSEFGIPVASFKKAIVSVIGMLTGGFAKHTNAALNIEPDAFDLVRLKTKAAPYSRRGVKNRPFLIYYQPVFAEWGCQLKIIFDTSMTTREHILSMLRHAGSKVGIGNNRPEKGGECGTFRIGKVKDLKVN